MNILHEHTMETHWIKCGGKQREIKLLSDTCTRKHTEESLPLQTAGYERLNIADEAAAASQREIEKSASCKSLSRVVYK